MAGRDTVADDTAPTAASVYYSEPDNYLTSLGTATTTLRHPSAVPPTSARSRRTGSTLSSPPSSSSSRSSPSPTLSLPTPTSTSGSAISSSFSSGASGGPGGMRLRVSTNTPMAFAAASSGAIAASSLLPHQQQQQQQAPFTSAAARLAMAESFDAQHHYAHSGQPRKRPSPIHETNATDDEGSLMRHDSGGGGASGGGGGTLSSPSSSSSVATSPLGGSAYRMPPLTPYPSAATLAAAAAAAATRPDLASATHVSLDNVSALGSYAHRYPSSSSSSSPFPTVDVSLMGGAGASRGAAHSRSASSLIEDPEMRAVMMAMATLAVQAASSASSHNGSPTSVASRSNSSDALASRYVRVERGVKTFAELHGVELYLYNSYVPDPACAAVGAGEVYCTRTRHIVGWEDMIGMSDVKQRLDDMILPTLNGNVAMDADTEQRTLFIAGPTQSGAGTAVHLFCRQNKVNLLDVHMEGSLPERYDWILESLVKENAPCVLMMHRFDTRWEDNYRWTGLGRLRDRWHSLERQPLCCWLVWVINTHANVNTIMPLYARENTPHLPVSIHLEHSFNTPEDLAHFGLRVMARRGLFRVRIDQGDVASLVDDQDAATQANPTLQQAIVHFSSVLCQNTHVLCTPGRVVRLIDKAIALMTRSASASSMTALPEAAAVASSLACSFSALTPSLSVDTLNAAFAHISRISQATTTGLTM